MPTFDHLHMSRSKRREGRDREEGIKEGAHIGIRVLKWPCMRRTQSKGNFEIEIVGAKVCCRASGRKGEVAGDTTIAGANRGDTASHWGGSRQAARNLPRVRGCSPAGWQRRSRVRFVPRGGLY